MHNDSNDDGQGQQRPRKGFRLLPPLRKKGEGSYNRDEIVINPAGVIARVVLGLAVIFLIGFLFVGLHTVDSHERAVVFHRDGSLSIMEPGKFQWVTPIFNTVTTYDVRDQTYTAEAIGISLDLQETTTEVTVRYHPKEDAIQTIHQTLGPGYEEKIIVPSVQDCVKTAVSYYNVEELTGAIREKVKQEIVNCIAKDLAGANLVAAKISITDFDFSEEFNHAIELKAIAQQKAEEEKNRLEQVKYQASQTIVQAEAQAQAARLLAQAANNQEGSAYLFLEWLKRWDGHLPTTLVSDNTASILLTPQKTS